MTLFHIADEFMSLLYKMENQAITNGGLVEDEIIEALEQTKGDFEEKARNICAVIAELESKANARSEHAQRLQDRAKIANNYARRLKEFLHQKMKETEITTIESPEFTITVAKNGGQKGLDVDHDKLPAEYFGQQVTQTLDTDRIREELDQGKELSFARYRDRGTHLRIK